MRRRVQLCESLYLRSEEEGHVAKEQLQTEDNKGLVQSTSEKCMPDIRKAVFDRVTAFCTLCANRNQPTVN
ncbi:hypothetical protein D9C73_022067 [Collichthys lucidus]|uniref:Uncharacterized protein n=1 Tax=Collichthys lucidus TaxID=240159 RepID=A0A4U5VHZ4_COLLU|nr:hypothetical protein D9C73_022067 [Collichthys lucidus]